MEGEPVRADAQVPGNADLLAERHATADQAYAEAQALKRDDWVYARLFVTGVASSPRAAGVPLISDQSARNPRA
jgi:hypothetical protein